MCRFNYTNNKLLLSFMRGFLYFFLLEDNPIKKYARMQRKMSDQDKICNDWYNVGNDIRNAYEKYKQATAG